MMTRREFTRITAAWSAAAALPRLIGAPTSTRITTVDTHAHIFERGLKLAASRRYTPAYDATLALYLGQLDSHGISHGVLVQPSFLGTDNSYILGALAALPDRLRGVAVVGPDASTEDLGRLSKSGFVGIRFNLDGEEIPAFGAPPWSDLLRRVVDLDWQVEVHRQACDLPQIVEPLLAAGAKVVVDHFGRPDPKLGVDDPGFRFLLGIAGSRRVWIKLSGAYRQGGVARGEQIARAAVPLLRRAFGPERLLWGSDWPHTRFEQAMNYNQAVKSFNGWITDPAERELILKSTPPPAVPFHLSSRMSFPFGRDPDHSLLARETRVAAAGVAIASAAVSLRAQSPASAQEQAPCAPGRPHGPEGPEQVQRDGKFLPLTPDLARQDIETIGVAPYAASGGWRGVDSSPVLRRLSAMSTVVLGSLILIIALGLGVSGCKSLRSGYKSAPYQVARSDGRFELRDYPSLTVVETPMVRAGADGSFSRLFRFITGNNDGSRKISMTTPVFMSDAGQERTMAFVMPAGMKPGEVPRPVDGAVAVRELPAGRFAVLRFSGARSAANEDGALRELRSWMVARGLEPVSGPVYAYFDPPWIPGFLRRNEVMQRTTGAP